MSDIAEILKGVAEVKLKIIPLTWKLVGADGYIDVNNAAYSSQEVDVALEEAEEYARLTERAVSHLLRLLR